MTRREEEKRARRKHRQLSKKVGRRNPVFYALAIDGNPIRDENGEMIGVWIA